MNPAAAVLQFLRDNTPGPTALLAGGFPALAWAALCLTAAGYLKWVHDVRTGYTRKVFHFAIFSSAAALHALWGTRAVCLFGAMTSLVVFYAVLCGAGHPLYEALARESDAPRRTHFVLAPYAATLLGGLAASVFCGEGALAGYLVAGLGDAIGEPVGTRWGRHIYRVWSPGGVPARRSLEGSAAVFAACLAALGLAVALSPALALPPRPAATLTALAAAFALLEAVSPHGWDNAILQVVPAWAAAVLLKGGPA